VFDLSFKIDEGFLKIKIMLRHRDPLSLIRKDRRFKEHLDMSLKAGRRIDPISVGQGNDGLPVPSIGQMEKYLERSPVRQEDLLQLLQLQLRQ
jgi:hypothetical protein